MANPPLDILLDYHRFDEWQKHNSKVAVEARNEKLVQARFSKRNLDAAVFDGTTFIHSTLRATSLIKAHLHQSTISDSNLSDTNLTGSRLTCTTIERSNLSRVKADSSNFSDSEIDSSKLSGAQFTNSSFRNAILKDVDCRSAQFVGADLRKVRFQQCDLRGANFSLADLSGTYWAGSRISSSTRLVGSRWSTDHDAPNDGSNSVTFPWFGRLINWRIARVIGHLPLFAGAYLLLTGSIAVYTVIAWLNESTAMTSLNYPIPFPPRLTAALWGSALLAIGTTLFELSCPARVKEFSITQWVEELRRPGILYLSDSLKRPVVALLAITFMFPGAIILALLFIERVVRGLMATMSGG